MEQLKQEIKEVIINSLQLEDIKPDNIVAAQSAVFGAGLSAEGGHVPPARLWQRLCQGLCRGSGDNP